MPRKLRIFALVVAAMTGVTCTRVVVVSAPPPTSIASVLDSIAFEPPPMCLHLNMPWTDYLCPEIVGRFPPFVRIEDVDKLWLVMRTRDGSTFGERIQPNVDAIFLGRMAVDSILVRYYRTIGQNAKADSLAGRVARFGAAP